MSTTVQLHPTPPPPDLLLRCAEDTICDPFEDRQIVYIMGVVLVVVAALIVMINSAAGLVERCSLFPPSLIPSHQQLRQ